MQQWCQVSSRDKGKYDGNFFDSLKANFTFEQNERNSFKRLAYAWRGDGGGVSWKNNHDEGVPWFKKNFRS